MIRSRITHYNNNDDNNTKTLTSRDPVTDFHQPPSEQFHIVLNDRKDKRPLDLS